MKNRSSRVAIILITDRKDNVLMGLRNDTNKWTNPAGSIEKGEDPYDGAIRELKEETGLDAIDIKLVQSEWCKKKGLLLYLFICQVDEQQVLDSSKDPDKECDFWAYIDPNDIKEDLHVPLKNNLALKYWIDN